MTVYVDPRLGTPGFQNAADLLSDADRVVGINNQIFSTPTEPVSVIVFALDGATDGTGGADHLGCTFQSGGAIEVCASFGNPARVSGLFEAELSECSMNGSLCGFSTGEALSRWCAAVVSNNALSDFATAPDWAEAGMPDFVNKTEKSDTVPVSTGCGMAFISWLISSGYKLPKIAQEMVALGDAGTLADLYGQLTGNAADQAWPEFKKAIEALPGGVTSDDPFGGFPPM
ncbi:hypothetical protein [Streptomyces fodineus]|uniref:hypothetical protein n=1 Tax=Streptomyces fodineus TaxID=1904616 RepID=UPI000AE9317F|nr:hypothetical protein [Streptomyces fodineus]